MNEVNVPHLKIDRGRYYYRRRVPKKHQKTLGETMWNRACGPVGYADAVAKVVQWTKEDDDLIRQLDNPEVAAKTRYVTEVKSAEPAILKVSETVTELGMKPREWLASKTLEAIRVGLRTADEHPEHNHSARLVGYRSIQLTFFGDHVVPPHDPEERDEFELLKRKVERRISDLAGDPNTISAVAERYYKFSGVKPGVRAKYRRNIRKLTEHVGDIPVGHLTAANLRDFRDSQAETMQASSLQAVFTPIKGLLNFAMSEQIIDINPYGSVQLQKDKRSIQARKWKPFTPEECQRIFQAMEMTWGSLARGLSDERRAGIWMVVRVQAFTGMRPREVLWLEPQHVNDKWIRVEDSKTDGSERVIPLHPEISDFPSFVHSGGLETFHTQEKDRVQAVRHNFYRLTRDFMDPPITDPKKVLYSWRSTFSNAMRRAGATKDMRRDILGHSTAGSLKHYDDGPEFFEKRKWVRATDPRRIYPDPGEYDELD